MADETTGSAVSHDATVVTIDERPDYEAFWTRQIEKAKSKVAKAEANLEQAKQAQQVAEDGLAAQQAKEAS